jgi:hypothetical protein
MQKQKCSLNLYTNFLIINQNRYSGLELSKVSPISDMHHDSVSRWLASSDFTPSQLWNQVESLINRDSGYLICDDTLLAKPYSRQNELARKQYSGKYHGLVNGICLVNLLWTDGKKYIPIDYRHYQKESDDKTKNNHFRDMLDRAEKREVKPRYTLMDSWYSSVENLKHIDKKSWKFICNLKSNRKVSIVKGTYLSISDLSLTDKQVRQVWLKEYGKVLVCKLVATNGDITYIATNDLSIGNHETFTNHWNNRWKIEEFHRGIKQTTGIEECYSVKATSQKNHIFSAFIAFVRLEKCKIDHRISWYEQKAQYSRWSTKHYLSLSNA